MRLISGLGRIGRVAGTLKSPDFRKAVVINLLVITIAMFGSALESPKQATLRDILAARREVYCESCPAARLKVFASFQLHVEQANPALGSDYFPISDLGRKVTNMSRWREETFRSGRQFKVRVICDIPEGYTRPIPGTYDLTVCYDGVHSWRYRPVDLTAEQFNGVTRATQVIQDYYGDMIGSKIPGGLPTMSRTVSAPSDALYDIDQVVASNAYEVVGKEDVAGEICTIIERPGTDRIWLANNKNFVVVKREWRWTQGGSLKRRIINSQFRNVGGGAWLPFTGRMEIFSHPSTPPERRVGVLTALVEAADTNFTDNVFQPGFSKGTRVTDLETGTRFFAGYSAAELAVEEAKETKRLVQKIKGKKSVDALAFQAEPWWQRNRSMLLGALAILVIMVLVFLRFRPRGGM